MIRYYLNKGLSDELKTYFPNVIPMSRPLVQISQSISPNWFSGFT